MGLALGSFLNVCIIRIPQKFSIGGRSACPHCHHKIYWYQNIPIFSYLYLRGRCAFCQAPIHWQYPLLELITMVLSLLTMYRVDFIVSSYLIWFLAFVCPLIVISFIDMKHRIIPDVISLPGISLGFLVILILQWPNWTQALWHSFSGFLAGGVSLYALALFFYWLKNKEGMGGGDIKISAMIGSFLSWDGILFTFFSSSILALMIMIPYLLFRKNKEEPFLIPYGPFLALGALLFFFVGPDILQLYFKSLGLIYFPKI